MKQILQHLNTGEVEVADIPCPLVRPGHLLIQTRASLISAGTERMLVEFGKGSLIAKARAQPEKVRQVLDKIRTDGLLPTLEVVFSRLAEPLPLGYCNAGVVLEVGEGVTGFAKGDRVVSNGSHAEIVCVPANLSAKIPDNVDDESAAFTVLAAIALHGVRLLQPTYGECFVVTGLGLVGLLAVQFLRRQGCRVLGVDFNPQRCELAREFGCDAVAIGDGADPVAAAESFSRGRGVDGVLLTAATKSSEPARQAANMCRKRGRIVSTGAVGLDLERGPLYQKELSVQVSCAYGPGRYDPDYEERNRDYPLPYVRWTVARNLEAVLDGMAVGDISVASMISHRFPQTNAAQAYEHVVNDSGSLGIVLSYPDAPAPREAFVQVSADAAPSRATTPVVGVIGAGNFAKLVLLPAIKATGAGLKCIASAGGVTAQTAARKIGAASATSDYRTILDDDEINTVIIATRHDSHARLVCEALRAGKHVFVEKPLCITQSELAEIKQVRETHNITQLMVGFNRRFAPHARTVHRALSGRSKPVAITMLVNAGHAPSDSWLHDPLRGGGRIIGEGCHWIDLALYLVGHRIIDLQATMFDSVGEICDDKMSIGLTFADGSIATLHYWANGPKSFPKERIEVFCEQRALVIDNWRRIVAYNWPGVPKSKSRQDKGHRAEIAQFMQRVTDGGPPLIPVDDLVMVTSASMAAVQSATQRMIVPLGTENEQTLTTTATAVS
ncbi:MAG: bi-domain-containing oxidoreductase [Phycisphaerales bacterium]|nr:bi-domain-containing oxidoreductase [Phycisphaerales bacterium]